MIHIIKRPLGMTMRKISLFIFVGLLILILAGWFWPQKRYQPFKVSEAYQAQVNEFKVPNMPSDWNWGLFTTEDGTQLRWGQTGNRGTAKTTIIIVPGYTATLKMYGEHIDMLAERGFHVLGVDLRGQGGSDRYFSKQPEKLWIEDFSTYSNDLAAIIENQNFSNERVVMPMAMSFGGHVAFRMAGEHSGIIDGLALLAPALEPKAGEMSFDQALKLMNWMRKFGQAKRYVPGGDNWKPFEEDFSVSSIELCSSNPTRLYLRDAIFTNNPEERVGDVTHQWGAEFFESSLYIRSEEFLQEIEIPIFMASAEVDNFVVTNTNHQICSDQLSHCEYKVYKGAGHCLPQESDQIIFDIFDNIQNLANKIKRSQ